MDGNVAVNACYLQVQSTGLTLSFVCSAYMAPILFVFLGGVWVFFSFFFFFFFFGGGGGGCWSKHTRKLLDLTD